MFNINKERKIEINKIIDKKNNIKNILDKLINFLCVHIKNQIEAGADVVQVFDSWAGLIEKNNLKIFVIFQTKR